MNHDFNNLTDAEKIVFGRKMMKLFKEAERRGIHPVQITDEENGCIVPDSDHLPCFLKRWTLFDDSGSPDIEEHNVLGQARIGLWGTTVYSTTDDCTLVRFRDGAELWCNTADLFIDESGK